MTTQRHYSPIDRLLLQADAAMRTLLPFSGQPYRPSPAIVQPDTQMSDEDTRHVAGLMRINHTGEVCAQALYQGQALTAKLPKVRAAMEHAAEEEIDHLVWCEQRIHQLGSHTSILNPLFYGMSFGIGAVAGLISDKVSLGFVAATEHQVCKHLNEHLEQLPAEDEKNPERSWSRCVSMKSIMLKVRWMRVDFVFPAPVKFGMSLLAKVMTKSTYRI
ncbi:2-polyprenyl-3-methyl-6-methoxy-1,4-benzoquinone monooxygenase [Pseudomonas lini]